MLCCSTIILSSDQVLTEGYMILLEYIYVLHVRVNRNRDVVASIYALIQILSNPNRRNK